jgi:hypothetical protein
METNGPANIIMLVDSFDEINREVYMESHVSKIYCKKFDDIEKEARMTINYLKEIAEVIRKHNLQDEIPKWHEVKAKYEKKG